MKTRKSTTPIADKEHALFLEYDKKCEFKDVFNDQVERIKCASCGCRFKYVMSAYAMSKGPNDVLVSCGCKSRLLWLHIIFRGEK